MNDITPARSRAHVWRERIEEQVRLRKSIRAFCKERQISPHTFYYWKQKFQKIKAASLASRFIAVTGRPHLASGFPHIHLPNGVRIELGESLESAAVSRFIRGLCGVGHPPEEGPRAKS